MGIRLQPLDAFADAIDSHQKSVRTKAGRFGKNVVFRLRQIREFRAFSEKAPFRRSPLGNGIVFSRRYILLHYSTYFLKMEQYFVKRLKILEGNRIVSAVGNEIMNIVKDARRIVIKIGSSSLTYENG